MADELDFSAFRPAERLDKVAEATALGKTVNCGWVRPDQRTTEQKRAHEGIVAAMPRFGIRGQFTAAERRYPLWKAGKAVLGKFLPYVFQQTGSCVGAGGCNMLMTAMAVEIALKGESEEFKVPWWLFTYGRSRYRAGMRGPGEGSIGSAWAEAVTKDGSFEIDPAGAPDLPDYKEQGGWIVQPSRVELEWSDGGRIQEVWLKLGVVHRFKTAAPVRSADEAAQAIINGYPLTQASDFGFRPMSPAPRGNPPVRVVEWNGRWSHQTYIDEYWDHPTEGELFRWGNNWGPDAHGPPTGDEPPGGVYIQKRTLDQIIRSSPGEVIAFSGYDGFPARELNFAAF